jgi:hypothetical protein
MCAGTNGNRSFKRSDLVPIIAMFRSVILLIFDALVHGEDVNFGGLSSCKKFTIVQSGHSRMTGRCQL